MIVIDGYEYEHEAETDYEYERERYYKDVLKEIHYVYDAVKDFVEAQEELNHYQNKLEEITPEQHEELRYEVERRYNTLTHYAAEQRRGHWLISEDIRKQIAEKRKSDDIISRLKRARSTKVKHKQLLDDTILEIMELRRQIEQTEN